MVDPETAVDDGYLAALHVAIDALASRDREIFMLHRFADLDYGTIAMRLGITCAEVEASIASTMVAFTDAALGSRS